MTPAVTRKGLSVQVRLQMPLRPEPTSYDGSGPEGQNRAAVRAALREALEEVRERMERNGRSLYGGRWRTREEIDALRWQARTQDLARVRDIALILLASIGLVAVAYQLLLLLFP